MEIVAYPRRKRDACYRQRVSYIVTVAPELMDNPQILEHVIEMEPADPTGGRWPYRGVGPVTKVSTSMDPYFAQGLAAIRLDRDWAEPAW